MPHVDQVRNSPPLIRPLSARSVVLSALLGAHPPGMSAGRLVRVGAVFGIAEGTIRVALSRMSATGDLLHEGDRYELPERLVRRQEQQDASRWPQTVSWRGDWRMVAVTATGRSRADRDAFRVVMRGCRFAELREGLWLRPNNLTGVDDQLITADGHELFSARPSADAAVLAARLWDLQEWAARARLLDEAMTDSLRLRDAFAVSAAVLRHLMVDPVLPPELLPHGWPGEALRQRYADFDERFRRELNAHLAGE